MMASIPDSDSCIKEVNPDDTVSDIHGCKNKATTVVMQDNRNESDNHLDISKPDLATERLQSLEPDMNCELNGNKNKNYAEVDIGGLTDVPQLTNCGQATNSTVETPSEVSTQSEIDVSITENKKYKNCNQTVEGTVALSGNGNFSGPGENLNDECNRTNFRILEDKADGGSQVEVNCREEDHVQKCQQENTESQSRTSLSFEGVDKVNVLGGTSQSSDLDNVPIDCNIDTHNIGVISSSEISRTKSNKSSAFESESDGNNCTETPCLKSDNAGLPRSSEINLLSFDEESVNKEKSITAVLNGDDVNEGNSSANHSLNKDSKLTGNEFESAGFEKTSRGASHLHSTPGKDSETDISSISNVEDLGASSSPFKPAIPLLFIAEDKEALTCSVCQLHILPNQTSIACNSCKMQHHLSCTDISDRFGGQLTAKQRAEWRCSECNLQDFFNDIDDSIARNNASELQTRNSTNCVAQPDPVDVELATLFSTGNYSSQVSAPVSEAQSEVLHKEDDKHMNESTNESENTDREVVRTDNNKSTKDTVSIDDSEIYPCTVTNSNSDKQPEDIAEASGAQCLFVEDELTKIRYVALKQGSVNGKPKLFDSLGFEYIIRTAKEAHIIWQCVKCGGNYKCCGTIKQINATFQVRSRHLHEGKCSAYLTGLRLKASENTPRLITYSDIMERVKKIGHCGKICNTPSLGRRKRSKVNNDKQKSPKKMEATKSCTRGKHVSVLHLLKKKSLDEASQNKKNTVSRSQHQGHSDIIIPKPKSTYMVVDNIEGEEPKLVDRKQGFLYRLLKSRERTKHWICARSESKVKCQASVKQVGNYFFRCKEKHHHLTASKMVLNVVRKSLFWKNKKTESKKYSRDNLSSEKLDSSLKSKYSDDFPSKDFKKSRNSTAKSDMHDAQDTSLPTANGITARGKAKTNAKMKNSSLEKLSALKFRSKKVSSDTGTEKVLESQQKNVSTSTSSIDGEVDDDKCRKKARSSSILVPVVLHRKKKSSEKIQLEGSFVDSHDKVDKEIYSGSTPASFSDHDEVKVTGGSPQLVKEVTLLAHEEAALVKIFSTIMNTGYPLKNVSEKYRKNIMLLFIEGAKSYFDKHNADIFPNNIPPASWVKKLVGKTPILSERLADNAKMSYSSLSWSKLHWFYNNFQTSLKEDYRLEASKYLDTRNAERIFSCDVIELTINMTKFDIDEKSSRFFQSAMNVLCCVNSAGQSVAPLIINKGKNLLNYESDDELRRKYSAACSADGNLDSNIFHEWLLLFDQELVQLCIARPVILFMNGSNPCISYSSIQFAGNRNIVLYYLPPYSDRELHPMRISLFPALKECFDKRFVKLRNRILPKKRFPVFFMNVYEDLNLVALSLKGFRSSGLCPYNSSVINRDKLFDSDSADSAASDVNVVNQRNSDDRVSNSRKEKVCSRANNKYQNVHLNGNKIKQDVYASSEPTKVNSGYIADEAKRSGNFIELSSLDNRFLSKNVGAKGGKIKNNEHANTKTISSDPDMDQKVHLVLVSESCPMKLSQIETLSHGQRTKTDAIINESSPFSRKQHNPSSYEDVSTSRGIRTFKLGPTTNETGTINVSKTASSPSDKLECKKRRYRTSYGISETTPVKINQIISASVELEPKKRKRGRVQRKRSKESLDEMKKKSELLSNGLTNRMRSSGYKISESDRAIATTTESSVAVLKSAWKHSDNACKINGSISGSSDSVPDRLYGSKRKSRLHSGVRDSIPVTIKRIKSLDELEHSIAEHRLRELHSTTKDPARSGELEGKKRKAETAEEYSAKRRSSGKMMVQGPDKMNGYFDDKTNKSPALNQEPIANSYRYNTRRRGIPTHQFASQISHTKDGKSVNSSNGSSEISPSASSKNSCTDKVQGRAATAASGISSHDSPVTTRRRGIPTHQFASQISHTKDGNLVNSSNGSCEISPSACSKNSCTDKMQGRAATAASGISSHDSPVTTASDSKQKQSPMGQKKGYQMALENFEALFEVVVDPSVLELYRQKFEADVQYPDTTFLIWRGLQQLKKIPELLPG